MESNTQNSNLNLKSYRKTRPSAGGCKSKIDKEQYWLKIAHLKGLLSKHGEFNIEEIRKAWDTLECDCTQLYSGGRLEFKEESD